MHASTKVIAVFALLLSLSISGCAPGQVLSPTITAIPASTSTAIPASTSTQIPTSTKTPTPTNTATIEPSPTATLAPICHLGDTVEGTTDANISIGYVDITKVSTSIKGTRLTVVFTLRELPDQITINQPC
jgi:hypothetical protein